MDKSTTTDDSRDIVTKNGIFISDSLVVPPLSNELKSPFHAMIEAVEYCK